MKKVPQIFLSYAREDKTQVAAIYDYLRKAGFKPWMDAKDLLPGKRWENEIEQAIRASDFFVVCLSTKSFREGFLQKEIRTALDIWQTKLEGGIYLIPVRLESCRIPHPQLEKFNWLDWFDEMERPRLLDAIHDGIGQPLPDPLRQTINGLTTATPENLKDLLSMPSPPQRVQWEKAQMEFCLVPAGEFVMGIDEDEAQRWHKEFGGELGWYTDATPSHRVHLDTYYLGRYPVTNRQYALFVKEAGHRAPYSNEDWAKPYNWDRDHKTPPAGKDAHPVVLVSWDDARAYCEWAGLRLPTEAEWEKAASWDPHAGRKRTYPWGDAWDAKRCNSAERLAGRELRTYEEWDRWSDEWVKLDPVKRNLDTTTLVGAYSPAGDSPYGCADMAGNVWEWVADWYDEGYYRVSPNRNPKGPDSGRYRVLRGGSWNYYRIRARSASRFRSGPGNLDLRGFRVCLSFTFSL